MFSRFATVTSDALGHPYAFWVSVLGVLAWAAIGPALGFSDTWQLIINTPTTVLTYLAVFLLQNSANRHARALHAKLDELIGAQQGARDAMLRLEDREEADIEAMRRDTK